MKFGRLPRAHNPHVPRLSKLIGDKELPPAPLAVDWSVGMPEDFGMMLNDKLGDCTCAAVYHAVQVWSYNSTKTEITEPDPEVLALYEQACGYDPQDPRTDQGGVEQDVLTYLVKNGYPFNNGTQQLSAFVEVDVTDLDNIKRTVFNCGGCYIGFNVPDTLDGDGNNWHTTTSDNIIGGHAVYIVGYDGNGLICISWGQRYRMSWAFFAKYCDEAYALADPEWMTAIGKTPGGLSLAQLEAAMQDLKQSDPADSRV